MLTKDDLMKFVKVNWIDACADIHWQLLCDVDTDVTRFTTVGFLVKETDECVVVAQSVGVEPKQVCNTMAIPKGCIKNIETIEENAD